MHLDDVKIRRLTIILVEITARLVKPDMKGLLKGLRAASSRIRCSAEAMCLSCSPPCLGWELIVSVLCTGTR